MHTIIENEIIELILESEDIGTPIVGPVRNAEDQKTSII